MRNPARTMRGRRARWLVSALVVTGVTVTSCGGASNGGSGGEREGGRAAGVSQGLDTVGADHDQRDPDGTSRYVFVQNPTNSDPARSSDAFDMIFLRLVYDQLIREEVDGGLVAQLATEWEFVDDETAFVMKSRDDVDSIDGRRFNAEARHGLPGIHRMVEEETGIRKIVPILAHSPPSAWTDEAAFPEGHRPAYSTVRRYVGVTS